MRCFFCNGNLYPQKAVTHTGKPGFACMQCGRSSDIRYELKLIIDQWMTKEHCNQQTYGTDGEYRYRRRMGLPPVGKKGRSGRRNKWG